MATQSKSRGWIDRLNAAAHKSPRKALVLGVLVLVMAVMWVRVLLKADPNISLGSALGVLESTPAYAAPATGKPIDPAVAQMQQWLNGPVPPLKRDLFQVDLGRYPLDPSRPVNSAATSQQNNNPDEKSATSPADVKKAREVLIENLRHQASELKLQSTMMGDSPKALVNGELVGEGDVVASFRVVKIEARGIIIEQEGIRLEILMK